MAMTGMLFIPTNIMNKQIFRRNIPLLRKGGRHGQSTKAKRRDEKANLKKEIENDD